MKRPVYNRPEGIKILTYVDEFSKELIEYVNYLEAKNSELLEALKVAEKQKLLGYALQQLIGWHEGATVGNITSLIDSMGLTSKEWGKLKHTENLTFLLESNIDLIDGFFKK